METALNAKNANDQVGIGFSFSSDWLEIWREVFSPIIERSVVNQNNS